MSKQDKNKWQNHINRKNEENEIETIEAVNSVTRQVKSQQNKILLNKPKWLKGSRVLRAFGHTTIPLLGELPTIEKWGEKEKKVVLVFANVEASTNRRNLAFFAFRRA